VTVREDRRRCFILVGAFDAERRSWEECSGAGELADWEIGLPSALLADWDQQKEDLERKIERMRT
jgi:hypothetical protein